jgi:hypothetical protein
MKADVIQIDRIQNFGGVANKTGSRVHDLHSGDHTNIISGKIGHQNPVDRPVDHIQPVMYREPTATS